MTTPLRIGFIPLCDAAALLIAVDKGLFAAEGLEIELVREVSWSNMRDKLNLGLFDAAHLLLPMAIASTLGIGHVKVPIAAPFVLSLNGNAITLSAPGSSVCRLVCTTVSSSGHAMGSGGPNRPLIALALIHQAKEVPPATPNSR